MTKSIKSKSKVKRQVKLKNIAKNKVVLPKKRTNIKKVASKKSKHLHIDSLPLKYFPKTKNNKAKEYRDDLVRMMQSLGYNNRQVQYSAQICIYNIKIINQKNTISPPPREIFSSLEEFVYHYENFCYRIFSYREKLLKFINEVLSMGLPERDATIKLLLMHSVVKEANIISTLEKFNKNKSLAQLIKDRNSLTHKLYYGKEFDHYLRPIQTIPPIKNSDFKAWCVNWKKEVQKRSDTSRKGFQVLLSLDVETAGKIIKFKNKKKKK